MPSRSMCLSRACVRTVVGVLALFSMVTSAGAEDPTAVSVSGPPALLLGGFDLAPLGYVTEEFFFSGTASSYTLAGAPTEDGHWNARPTKTAPYATRVVVVRPTEPQRFSGTVVVEWLNVTAGADGAPDWNMTHREIVRRGHAYVGVSAQKVGVEGGTGVLGAAAPALKEADPERYGRLTHPGDAFSYDIFSQAGRLVREADSSKILGPLAPNRVIAIGESQSAVFLTTYVNAVDPVAKAYDGFLIHSRFGSAASLGDTGMGGDVSDMPRYVRLRTDLRTPVITVITETDMLDGRLPGFHGARQPNNERLRVWEVAGTAHADNYTFSVGFMDSGSAPLEKLAEAYEATADVRGMQLAKPMNNAPQHHYVLQAALWHLDRWITAVDAPPKPPLSRSPPARDLFLRSTPTVTLKGVSAHPGLTFPPAVCRARRTQEGPSAFLSVEASRSTRPRLLASIPAESASISENSRLRWIGRSRSASSFRRTGRRS